MNEVQEVLKILSQAIIRETAAFNYYYKRTENTSLPAEVRGLLQRLAEEERIHRRLLMNEYISIEKNWNEDWDEETGPVLTYPVPDDPPVKVLAVSPCLEAIAISLPAMLVGGDNVITSVIKEKNNEIAGTFLTLYDVMGHGLKTTEVNALANKILGEYIDSAGPLMMDSGILDPATVVMHLNREMSAIFEGQGVFLTLLSALFHMSENTMTYTIAGHEPPFIIRNNGVIESLLNTQLVVGIDPEFHYRQHSVPFNEGDIFCVFSDGIIEARNDEGEMFDREGVSMILQESSRLPLSEIIDRLLKKLKEFCGDTPLSDEITIVLVAAKGEK